MNDVCLEIENINRLQNDINTLQTIIDCQNMTISGLESIISFLYDSLHMMEQRKNTNDSDDVLDDYLNKFTIRK